MLRLCSGLLPRQLPRKLRLATQLLQLPTRTCIERTCLASRVLVSFRSLSTSAPIMAPAGTKRSAGSEAKAEEEGEDERALDPGLVDEPDVPDEEMTRPAKKLKYGAQKPFAFGGDNSSNTPRRSDFNPTGKLPVVRPTQSLRAALEKQAESRPKGQGNVVYWMRMRDLRTQDNRALAKASALARARKGAHLIALHIFSPQDFAAHDRSPRRIDFTLRNLKEIQRELEDELHIPLAVLSHEPRTDIPNKVLQLCREWGASDVVGNIEYEVDELWRDIKVVEEAHRFNVRADFVDDSYIVPPGLVCTKDGRQYSVFKPWSRKWAAVLADQPELLEESPAPSANDEAAVRSDAVVGGLFGSEIPASVAGFECHDAARMRELWPAGARAAHEVLDNFIKGKGRLTVLEGPANDFSSGQLSAGAGDSRLARYQDSRNMLAENGSSRMSPYLSAGVISARACMRRVRDAAAGAATTKKQQQPPIGRGSGPAAYNLELGFRDFYGHVLAAWPRVCMGRAYAAKYEGVAWEDDDEAFAAWREGRTGYPIVDAAMRQVAAEGYMHNRGRMIVAMFLSKHLMQDWRKGEAWFMRNLIDGDFASNNGGWQWSASTGADAQPYFRIFSPLSQSEKCDPDGAYIRHWVPELAGVEGDAVHAPHERLAGDEFERLGYPRPIVEHKFARERALRRFKNIGER